MYYSGYDPLSRDHSLDLSRELSREGYAEPDDRVTHLVFVDGRLVETWQESARGSRWQEQADRLDKQRRPPAPPPSPPYAQALTWLTRTCGSAEAVESLSNQPLVPEGPELPEVPERRDRDRLVAVAELLDAVTEQHLDVEMGVALRRALHRVWAEDPEVVRGARTAAQVAGGLCWAVGKANGCFAPVGPLRVGRVQDALGFSSSLAGYGHRVRAALWGYRALVADDLAHWRPAGVPDLLPLGHADLLVASTREGLLRLRDQARQARDLAA